MELYSTAKSLYVTFVQLYLCNNQKTILKFIYLDNRYNMWMRYNTMTSYYNIRVNLKSRIEWFESMTSLNSSFKYYLLSQECARFLKLAKGSCYVCSVRISIHLELCLYGTYILLLCVSSNNEYILYHSSFCGYMWLRHWITLFSNWYSSL